MVNSQSLSGPKIRLICSIGSSSNWRRYSSVPTAKSRAKSRIPSGLWKAATGAQGISARKISSAAAEAAARCSRG